MDKNAFPFKFSPMIDLHCHTTASDGITPPEELPRLAENLGLSAVAITDHDTHENLGLSQEARRDLEQSASNFIGLPYNQSVM